MGKIPSQPSGFSRYETFWKTARLTGPCLDGVGKTQSPAGKLGRGKKRLWNHAAAQGESQLIEAFDKNQTIPLPLAFIFPKFDDVFDAGVLETGDVHCPGWAR
ncbi:MAG: hypothetical protein HND47_14415 [Chloroflexi bacterium]|nr:hypothetical protein [Chloroflexota bacterium]